MSSINEGFPPNPFGTEAEQTAERSYVQAAPQEPQSSPALQVETKSKGGSVVKPALIGLVGGVVGALAVSLTLGLTGALAGFGGTTQTSSSAAGQTISISANNVDTETAKAVAAKDIPSVVSIYVVSDEGEGVGSGSILDTKGNILTNYHVVENAQTVSVTIGDKSYDATVVGTDASSDLAVVHAELDGDKVTPIEVGDSDALVVGDWVATIGSPFGLDQSLSTGVVSSLARNQLMQSASGNTLYANLIQTDANVNPGNSGGALVNEKGELVGVPTLFSSNSESFSGIGFAIPSNYAIDIANKIIAGEQVTHAYIGLTMSTVNAQTAQQKSLSINQGAYVEEVAENSPAAEAGIKAGDIVTAMNGEAITSSDGAILAVRSHKIGETVELTLMRGNKEMSVKVTLGSDEELQKRQQQELEERQNSQRDNSYNNPYDRYYNDQNNGDSYGDMIWDWFFNNRGGSYEISE